MPEPITIGTSVLAIISFLNTAKTAIVGIAKDVDRFTTYHSDLKDLLVKFRLQVSKIETWKQLWRIEQGLGLEFYRQLWGNGCSDIEDALSAVTARAEQVWIEVERRLGLLASPHRRTRHEFRRQNRNHGFWTRLCDSLIRSELLAEHLSKLGDTVDSLEELSRILVRKQHGHKLDAANNERLVQFLEKHFNKAFLTNVVCGSRSYSLALFDQIYGENKYTKADLAIDVLLDIPTEVDLLHTGYAVGARNVIYDIIYSKQDYYRSGTHERFVITANSSEVIHTPFLPCYSSQQRLRAHSTKLKCDCASDPLRHFKLQLADEENNMRGVSQLCYLNHADLDNDNGLSHSLFPSKTIRRLLRSSHNDFIQYLHGDFTKVEQVMLAYHLAIFTCLLMHSGWTSQICSCTITYAASPQQRRYFVRVGDEARHYEPVTGRHHTSTQQWCEELDRMPIRRLGLLLTEIAIGATIYDVTFEQGILEVDFNHFWDGGLHPPPSYALDIRRKVESKAGTSYADIVDWCLTQRLEPVDSLDYVPEAFYRNVLQPLRVQYNAIDSHSIVLQRYRNWQEQIHSQPSGS